MIDYKIIQDDERFKRTDELESLLRENVAKILGERQQPAANQPANEENKPEQTEE